MSYLKSDVKSNSRPVTLSRLGVLCKVWILEDSNGPWVSMMSLYPYSSKSKLFYDLRMVTAYVAWP
jgi:hypothetical protein